MEPIYYKNGIALYNCKCEDLLDFFIAEGIDTIDACVTDPPYGLRFMGKKWDYDVPSVAMWENLLRVIRPGAHILSACGTRTQHRMAVNIEDAGFEIRDVVAWLYGSGFPKSMDVSKALDKAAGAERKIVGINRKALRNKKRDTTWTGDVWGDNGATITEPSTDLAKKWNGWGTALKPAMELWTLARKPLDGTVVENVVAHGCGGLNIDGCRVDKDSVTINRFKDGMKPFGDAVGCAYESVQSQGRWPANVCHDGSEEVEVGFPYSKSGAKKPHVQKTKGVFPKMYDYRTYTNEADEGLASRFFYCAKASQKERGEGNTHPTVKPLALMKWLIKLITPPGGIVIDPFAGSGTTLLAAQNLGFEALGCEQSAEYCEIAIKRLSQAKGN